MAGDVGLVTQLMSKEIRESSRFGSAIRILADIGCMHGIVSMVV